MLTYEPNYDIFVEALLFAGLCFGTIIVGMLIIAKLRELKEEKFLEMLDSYRGCNCTLCRKIRSSQRHEENWLEPECSPGGEGTDERGAWLQGWWLGIDDPDQYIPLLMGEEVRPDVPEPLYDCGMTKLERGQMIERERDDV